MQKTSDAKLKAQREYEKRSGYEANKKYAKEKTRMYALRVAINVDPDIIEKLDSVPSRSAYLKHLIREDIAKEKGLH